MAKIIHYCIIFSVLFAFSGCAKNSSLSENDKKILEYAASPYDKAEMMHKRVVIGEQDGTPIVADFPCGDICPDYTVREFFLSDGPIENVKAFIETTLPALTVKR